MRCALINGDGLVVNAIVWDGQTEYTPANGLTVVAIPDGVGAGPGWTYTDGEWIAPPPDPDDDID